MGEKNTVKLTGEASVVSETSAELSLSQRLQFSNFHILSAVNLAQQAYEIEKAFDSNRGDELDAIFAKYRGYVVSSIVLSFAAVEAIINELFGGVSEGQYSSIDKNTRQNIKAIWDYMDKRRKDLTTLEMYQEALDLLGKPQFAKNKDAKLYYDVDLLRLLRNALVHFKPDVVDFSPYDHENRPKRYKSFDEQVLEKIECVSPLLPDAQLLFPDKILGYGCAKWAVESSVKFVDAFFDRIGIPSAFEPVREQLKLPDCTAH